MRKLPHSLIFFIVGSAGFIIIFVLASLLMHVIDPKFAKMFALFAILCFTIFAIGLYAGIRDCHQEGKTGKQNRAGLICNAVMLLLLFVVLFFASITR